MQMKTTGKMQGTGELSVIPFYCGVAERVCFGAEAIFSLITEQRGDSKTYMPYLERQKLWKKIVCYANK